MAVLHNGLESIYKEKIKTVNKQKGVVILAEDCINPRPMSRKAYKSDLNDEQWKIIEPLIPPAKPGGHPRTVNLREVVNAIFYVLRTGCPWEMLPHDLPPYSTVYFYFRRWQKRGVWEKMNNALRRKVRQQEGREPQASAGSADSQSVKTTEKRVRCTALMVAKGSKDENAIS